MKTLTIGIPSYNVENYIAECLDSILLPELVDDLEVLVINDGSTDGTEAVAREYEKLFPETVRVISKENGGWGSGVNLAISEARGKYFKNLDSDDFVSPEGFTELVRNMKENDADAFIAPANNYEEGTARVYPHQFPNGCIFGRVVPFSEMCGSIDFIFRMHCLAFRTEMLQKNNIRVDECFYSDLELISYPFEYVNTVYAQEEPVNMYRIGRNGQSMSIASMAKHIPDIERVGRNMISWYLDAEKRIDDPAKLAFCEKLAKISVSSYLLQPSTADNGSSYIPELREYKKNVLDASERLSDLSGYSFFAAKVLKSNFNNYAFWGEMWKLSLGKAAKTASKLWNFTRKFKH